MVPQSSVRVGRRESQREDEEGKAREVGGKSGGDLSREKEGESFQGEGGARTVNVGEE